MEPAEAIPTPEAIPEIVDLPVPPPPELTFAARVPPPEPDRPRPPGRRAVFFDVENTSRASDVKRMLEQLAIDRFARSTDLVASGNWRVIGHETARLLAGHGAHLVHSAPATGVRDWSDLRIAVAAGVWLASARPGDELDIVSDDKAFDVLGDAAASLGVTFRRLSFRGATASGARGRGRGRRATGAESEKDGARRVALAAAPPLPPTEVAPAHAPPESEAPPPAAPVPTGLIGQEALDDQVLTVVQQLLASAPAGVTLDAVAARLRDLGFQRRPGSPRLVTRLRAMKELDVSPRGLIRLREAGAEVESAPPAPQRAQTSTRRRRGGRGRRRANAPA